MNPVLLEGAISVSQITLFSNLGFFAIILFAVIGFIIGVAKGVWKQSFSFIYYGLLILLLILMIGNISTALYNMDLTWISNTFNITFEVDGAIYTTPGTYARAFVEFMAKQNNINVNMADVAAQLDGLAIAIIRLVAFLVGLIVILLTGIILCPLLYHLIFKHFIPKKTREKKKVRWLGGLLSFVKVTAITTLFIVPFSGLVSSVTRNLKDDSGNITRAETGKDPSKAQEEQIYDTVMNILQGYDESILAKVLGVNLGGVPLDVAVMNYITQTDLGDGNKTSLYDELGAYGSIFVEALGTGAINLSTGTISWVTLLESSFAKSALYTLADTTLINVLLPVAVNIAIGATPDIDHLDLSQIDISSVDWSSTLKSVGDIIDDIANTGYISGYFNNPDTFLNEFALDRSQQTKIKHALKSLGDSSIIKELMPQITAAYFGSYKETTTSLKNVKRASEGSSEEVSISFDFEKLLANLPEAASSAETYKDISWGDELVLLYDVALNISEQYKAKNNKYITFGEMSTVFDFNNLSAFLFGTDESLVTAEDYQNNPYLIGGTVNGTTIVGAKNILGVDSTSTVKGLLDSSVMNKALFGIDGLKLAVENISLSGQGSSLSSISELKEEVKDWTMNSLKSEFSSLLDVSAPILKVVDSITTSLDGVADEDKATAIIDSLINNKTAITYFCDQADSSYLVGSFVPTFGEDYLGLMDTNIMLGLRTSDFQLTNLGDETSFYKELKTLVNDSLSSIKDTLDVLTSASGDFTAIIDAADGIEDTLKAIYKCKIINPVVEDGEQSNFTKVMIRLLTELPAGEEESINIPKLTNNLIVVSQSAIEAVSDWDSNNGEITHLFDVIRSLKAPEGSSETQILLDYLGDSSISLADSYINMGDEVKRIFATIDSSILMKSALPETLNNTLSDVLSSSGLSINFTSVTDWNEEGEHLGDALNTLKDIKGSSSETDIATLIQNADSSLLTKSEFEQDATLPTQFNSYDEYFALNSDAYALLNEISATQSIGESNALGTLLFDTLKDILVTETGLVTATEMDNAKSNFEFVGKNVPYNSTLYVSWNGDSSSYYGEALNITKLLIYKDSLSTLSTASSDTINDVLDVLIDNYVLRSLIGPILNNSVSDLKDGSDIDLVIDGCDFSVFASALMNRETTGSTLTTRQEEIAIRKATEIPAIVNIFDEKDNLSGTVTKATIVDLTTVDANGSSRLTTLLESLHNSYIFNSQEMIDSKTGTNRDTLTAYEAVYKLIFNSQSVFTPLTDSELFAISNTHTGTDTWVSGTKAGEIYDFNKALNDTINSEIYDKVEAGISSIDDVKELYYQSGTTIVDNTKTPIEDLFTTFESSILLSKQLINIVDTNIYSQLKSNLSGVEAKVTTEGNYLVDNVYENYATQKTIVWSDEGKALDDMIKVICDIDINDIANIDGTAADNLFEAVKGSKVLSYAGVATYGNISLDSSDDERSYYQYLINCFDANIALQIFDNDTFDIGSDLTTQKGYTTTKDVYDYEGEQTALIGILNAYNSIKNDSSLYDNATQTFNIDLNDEKKVNALNDKVYVLLDALKDSQVFNYRLGEVDSEGNITDNTNYYKDTSTYKDHSLYEHAIRYISKEIYTNIEDKLGINSTNNYSVSGINADTLTNLKEFYYEQDANKGVLTAFSKLTGISSSPTLNDINDSSVLGLDNLNALYTSIKASIVMNHTSTNGSHTGVGKNTDVSLYDNMVIFLANTINQKLGVADTTQTTVANIISNKFLNSDETYADELELYLSDNGIIKLASDLGLDGSVTMDMSFARNNNDNLLGLLEKVSESRVMNHTLNASPVGSEYSSFEQLVYKVVGQSTITTQIYDTENDKQKELGATNGEGVLKEYIKLENRGAVTSSTVGLFTGGTVVKGDLNKIFGLFDTISGETIDVTSIEAGADKLKLISDIYILHDMVPYLIRTKSESTSVGTTTLGNMALNHTPNYYVLEPSDPKDVASSYDTEIAAIVSMTADATSTGNLNGDVSALGDEQIEEIKTNKMFEKFLTHIAASEIFGIMGPDYVTSILDMITINVGTSYSVGYFINLASTASGNTTINKARASVVEANNDFIPTSGIIDTNTYALQGASIDDFLVNIAKAGKYPTTGSHSFEQRTSTPNYIGYVMMQNAYDTNSIVFHD